MSLIQVDLVGWLPDSLKQQIIDSVVTFVAEQAKKVLGDEVSQALKRLRSDAGFQDAVDQGLKEATDRFVREYMAEDEDLVAAIAGDPDFWKAESVREALLEIVRHPGVYLTEERMTLARGFADVLRQRVNRERVDRAVTFYLRCVAESLWHLGPLRPVYELQIQRLSVERATEMVQELRGMRADVQGAMMALVQAIGEQQKLLAAPDKPTLPEPKKVYHNLPQPDYGIFIGREEELAQVHRILRPYPHSQEHLVTIDGIGGIGKSALALETAHRYLREYEVLPEEERFGAIIWTSAKSSVLTADGIKPRQQITRTLDDIYTTISVTLEREDITRAQSEEQDKLVTKALIQQRTLLIVDNMETVDDERVNAFLRELLAPTKAIITTRHRIDVAYPVRLTGMPREDGLTLIARECVKKGVTLAEEETESLYDRTGGVPLAIVWSVAQMGYGYSVETVLRRLGQPSEDIARFCFEGTMGHIQGKPAHKLLMALSLFPTDASRETLGYVANLPVLDRDEGLAKLMRLSLVNKQADRFTMLPLTKEFASAQTASQPAFVMEARERIYDKMIQLFEKASQEAHNVPGQFSFHAFLSLESEIETILHLMDGYWRTGDKGRATGLFQHVENLLWARGYWGELIKHLQLAILSDDLEDSSSRRADYYSLLGRTYLFKEEFEKAKEHLEKAHALYQANGVTKGLSHVSAYLGNTYISLGETEKARQVLDHGLDIAISEGHAWNAGRIQNDIARLDLVLGRLDKAQKRLEDFLRHTDENNLRLRVTYCLLGRIALARGDYSAAQALLDKGLVLAQMSHIELDVAEIKYWMALSAEKSGEFKKAIALASESLDAFKRLGVKSGIAAAEALVRRIKGSK